MGHSPSYEELRQRVHELEEERRKRLQAEEESEKRQRYLEGVLQNAPDAVVTLDSSHRVVEWNAGAQRMFGYSPEEVQGRDLDELITRFDEASEARDYTRHVLAGNSVEAVESVRYSKEGNPVHVLISGSPIIRDQRLAGIVAIYTDVTERKRMEEAYKQERDHLDHILEYSPDGIAIVNESGEFIRWNNRAAELFGYSFEEMRGRKAFGFYADKHEMEAMLQELRTHGYVRNYEIDFIHKRGERIHCSVSMTLLRYHQGKKSGSISIIRDLREWKEMLQTIREQEEKFKGIASSALDAVIMMDDQGRISYWNPAAEKIFGYTAQEAMERDLHELIAPRRYHQAFWKSFPDFQRKGTGDMIDHSYELRALHKNGSEFPVDLSISALKLRDAWHSVGIVRDISDRKIMEEKLQRMANTDQLTGAYNRHKFLECLDYEISRVKRSNASLSLVMLDIDHFKRINDTYGHNTGDAVLQELVRVIRNNLREVDLLTRWGGEEFIILTPDTGKLSAATMAERLRREVEAHDFSGAGSVTISLGIAQYSRKETVNEFITRVDERMYLAKQSGRNRVK